MRREDDLGDEETDGDEATGDERETVHDAQEQQQSDHSRHLDAAAQRRRSRALAATALGYGKGEEQRGQGRSGAHRDRRDDETYGKRNVRIDRDHRARGDERAPRGHECKDAPDR